MYKYVLACFYYLIKFNLRSAYNTYLSLAFAKFVLIWAESIQTPIPTLACVAIFEDPPDISVS